MDMMRDIPQELYDDEIITFLAGRYRTSAENIVRWFFVQEGILRNPDEDMMLFRLEENEMEMLRGLTKGMLATDRKEK